MVAAMEPRAVSAERSSRATASDDATARPPRAESPERWQKALGRAMAAGLEVFRVADTGELMVTSASKLDTLHRTDGRACTCEAALAGDPTCQHRAVARFVLGLLPASPPPAAVCSKCLGTGRHEEEREEEGVLVAYAVPCACPAADRWADALLGYELAWDRHHAA